MYTWYTQFIGVDNMKAYCLLELFKEKEYISINQHSRRNKYNAPPYFIVRSKVTSEIIPKMIEIIKNDNDYICHHNDNQDYFYYTIKNDLMKFLEGLKELNKENINIGQVYLTNYEQEWINENTQFWCKDSRNIINKEIRGKRIIKEEQNNKDAIDLINKLASNNIPDELIFSDIKMKYDYDYAYTADDGHPVDSHEKIVPSFKNMIEIFSDLYDHDLGYNSIFGPNREYLEKSLKEIKRMEAMKKEIEETYGDKVKCILSDWNEGCQFGCALYIYIL